MAGIRVEHGDDLRLGFPLSDVVLDELKMDDRSGKIFFERQGSDAEHHLYFRQPHRNVDAKRFLRNGHNKLLWKSQCRRAGPTGHSDALVDEAREERGRYEELAPFG